LKVWISGIRGPSGIPNHAVFQDDQLSRIELKLYRSANYPTKWLAFSQETGWLMFPLWDIRNWIWAPVPGLETHRLFNPAAAGGMAYLRNAPSGAWKTLANKVFRAGSNC